MVKNLDCNRRLDLEAQTGYNHHLNFLKENYAIIEKCQEGAAS